MKRTCYSRHRKDLWDKCIQNFIWEVYRRIYGWKFSFTATRERSRKT